MFVTEADLLSEFSSFKKEESMEARKEQENSKFASLSGEYNVMQGEDLTRRNIVNSVERTKERPNPATRNSMNNGMPFNRSTRLISAQ